MSFQLGEAFVEFGARDSKFVSTLASVKAATDSIGSRFAQISAASNTLFLGLFGGAGIIGLLSKQAGEQAMAEKRLQAALENTGHAAGFTAEELTKQAEALSKVSNFSKTTTIAAEAMLAEFKNIKGDTFIATVKAAQDLSATFDTDLTESIRGVGAAMSDPEHNALLLRRQLRAFSVDVIQSAQAMAKSGDVAGAQKAILAELTRLVGGNAEKFRSGFKQMRNAVEELSVSLGKSLKPAIAPLVADITALAEAFQKLSPRIGQFMGQSLANAAIAAMGIAVMGKFAGMVGMVGKALAFINTPIGAAIAGLGALAGWFVTTQVKGVSLVEKLNKAGELLAEGWAKLRVSMEPALQGMADIFVGIFKQITDAASGVWGPVGPLWEDFKTSALGVLEGIGVAFRNFDLILKLGQAQLAATLSEMGDRLEHFHNQLNYTGRRIGEVLGVGYAHFLKQPGDVSEYLMRKGLQNLFPGNKENEEALQRLAPKIKDFQEDIGEVMSKGPPGVSAPKFEVSDRTKLLQDQAAKAMQDMVGAVGKREEERIKKIDQIHKTFQPQVLPADVPIRLWQYPAPQEATGRAAMLRDRQEAHEAEMAERRSTYNAAHWRTEDARLAQAERKAKREAEREALESGEPVSRSRFNVYRFRSRSDELKNATDAIGNAAGQAGKAGDEGETGKELGEANNHLQGIEEGTSETNKQLSDIKAAILGLMGIRGLPEGAG